MLAALLAYGSIVVPTRARAQDTAYAFVGVAVIPMDSDSARVLHDQTVVVRGDRIVALGPAAKVAVPTGARRIDGRRKFLIPGLADMHAHPELLDTTGLDLYAFVANGVTTIRALSAIAPPNPRALALRTRAAKGELISPRIYVAAGANSPEDVRQAKAAGLDLIKVLGMDGPPLDSVAAAAHQLGMPLVGHAPDNLQRAIDVGYASTEHLYGFDWYLSGGRHHWWDFWYDTTLTPQDARQMVADSAKLRALAIAMRNAGVWTCPTTAMYEAEPMRAATTWPDMRYVPVAGQERRREQQDLYIARHVDATTQAALDVRRAIVKALHDAGAGLLLGTDSWTTYMVPGFSVHHELEAFVRAGLTPYEALLTGTRNVAQFFGTLDSTGTVAAGKRADLVLLSDNPLEDIRRTAHPAGVMLGGRWLDRAELDRGLAAIEGKLVTEW